MATTIHAPSLASETVATIGSFTLRNTMLMAWLAMAVLIIIALLVRSTGYKQVPGRLQTAAEMVIEGFFNFFNSVLHDEAFTRRVFPLVATLFLFIALSNWMGIFPGVGPITMEHEGTAVPLFRSMNADVNMTLTFALISMLSVQYYGMRELGFFGYAGKFFVAPWKDFFGSFVGFLEIVSEFSKIISFTFRLFGNIFAGEVLLVVISFLVAYLAPLPFLGLEIFVGFIQALVFSMLTLVFLKMGITGHEHEHDDHMTGRELSEKVLTPA